MAREQVTWCGLAWLWLVQLGLLLLVVVAWPALAAGLAWALGVIGASDGFIIAALLCYAVGSAVLMRRFRL